jgi:protocatechuate 3,4-dioxygenase beta subunit
MMWSRAARAEPTPACGDDGEPTPRQTAGPYYKPASPERRDLRAADTRGEPITLAGQVLNTQCQLLAGVIVEIWHADANGEYDNTGFRLRGWQRTDASGCWQFDTIVTRDYSNRTAHYHFRVQPNAGRALVTQLYFPGHARNTRDNIFDPRLVMRLSQTGTLRNGRYDFILPATA